MIRWIFYTCFIAENNENLAICFGDWIGDRFGLFCEERGKTLKWWKNVRVCRLCGKFSSMNMAIMIEKEVYDILLITKVHQLLTFVGLEIQYIFFTVVVFDFFPITCRIIEIDKLTKKLRELLFRAHTKFGLTCSTSEKTLMMFKPVSFLMSVWVQLVFLSSSATSRGYVLTSSRPSGVLREWESVRKEAHKCCSNITLAPMRRV